MIGAGAVAALTVIGAGLVPFPVAVDDPTAVVPQTDEAGAKARSKTKVPVKYVRLKPGQKAPKGAKVIREAVPTPRIVVRRVSSPAQKGSTRVVARTKQSG